MELSGKIKWLSTAVNTVVANFSIVLFLMMTVIVWAQIFFRYVLGDGIVWAEEIAKYMMVWMALLGAAVVFYEQGHISIDFFVARRQGLRWIKLFHNVIAAGLFVVLIVCGIEYAQFGQKFISPASGIRRFWPYCAIPVGGCFLLLQCILRIAQLLFCQQENQQQLQRQIAPVTDARKESAV